MKATTPLLGMLSCLCAAGCAIHPLPENVTGLSTYQIVRQIRCETRKAVIDAAVGYLTTDAVDPASREIGIRFATQPDEINKLNPKLFKGEVRRIFDFFWNTGVAYNYTLTATEINNLDASLNIMKPFTGGLFQSPLGGNFDRQRQNSRTFTITDKFGSLVEKTPLDYCNGKIVEANYVYPISGKIGIDKVVRDFVNLSLFGNLGGKDKGPPTLVDTLDFQTTISASAAPEVMFTPMSAVARLSDAKLTGTASRKDDHQVIVSLALDPAQVKGLDATRTSVFGSLLTAAPKTGSEQLAAAAADQVLTRKLFQPILQVGNF